ncbi:MAG: hypothetical protein JWM43_2954 [Acidobacteriaceae bacterium]|nr:hypothetical protein [Acidobacteriaceae bacterium]
MNVLLRTSRYLKTTVFTLGISCSLFSAPALSAAPSPAPRPEPVQTVLIPGPLRSFERMAGISQKVAPADVLPFFARNVYMLGYHQSTPTEFLILVDRYLQQARELQVLAGSAGVIKVNGCDDAGTLIQILGYRLRPDCGKKNFSLETANPERAFLTIDSGFPLVDLEEALQNGTPFLYPYASTRVPALFYESDWAALRTGQRKVSADLVDVLIGDRFTARLYWAMAKEDTETRTALRRSPGLRALLPYAGVLDFYGSQICIRSGHVQLPGGTAAQASWRDLAGANPDVPGQFVPALLAKDSGWLAAYFDALSRISQVQQKPLTQSPRLKRLYEAFRQLDPETSATHGVFRKAPDLLVLFTRIQFEPDGQPRIPGDLATWKDVLHQKTDSKVIHEWGKRSSGWNTPEQMFEGMAGLARVETEAGPLQSFLLISEIDRKRQPGNRLTPATVRLLADRFPRYKSWYQIFTEFQSLDNTSITRFVSIAEAIDKIPNQNLRANTEGSFQATVGLWQILARQGQLPTDNLNPSWTKVLEPFATVSSPVQLFDATQSSLGGLLAAAGANPTDSQTQISQSQIIDLISGPRQDNPDSQRVRLEMAERIRAVLDDQRLASLDTVFALSDGLKDMAQSKAKGDRLLPLAEELREFDMPKPIFTNREKINWAPAIYVNHHAELQVRTDLTKILKGQATHEQLEAARGQLAPFLRDTLVGLNYAYYEPPGAQMLHHNPLFVRSHDFLGVSIMGSNPLWGSPVVVGAGSPAGGGAYLIGSLADLPFALATIEQDFIAPKNVQALIWKELTPVLIVSATTPRYWGVTPNELHAVNLYQRCGEELLTAAASNPELRTKVLEVLSDRIAPQRMEELEHALLRPQDVSNYLNHVMPAETFYLAAEVHTRFPDLAPSWGPASLQLEELRTRFPAEVTPDRIARDFGVPHPTLAQTNASDLLHVKPFPFFGSNSGRLFGESWESGNLYWARLADEMGYSPAALNSLAPNLTRRTIANIFATEFEDWPAVLRAMHETGDEFRQSKLTALATANPGVPASDQPLENTTTR